MALLVVGLALGDGAPTDCPAPTASTAFAERWPRVLELARRLRDGLAVAGRPRTLVEALVFSALAWAASIGTFLAAGQAIGVELSIGQAALIASGVALATIVPAGPGYLGTFELTAVGIAERIGIPREEAFALALLVHVMILVVTSVGGVIAILACVGGRGGRGGVADAAQRRARRRPTIRRRPRRLRPSRGCSSEIR